MSANNSTIGDVVDVARVDPTTGQSWPEYLDTRGTSHYLRIRYGLTVAQQTLAHRRSSGTGGLIWQYLGQRPVIKRSAIDDWIRDGGALAATSPLAWRGEANRKATAWQPSGAAPRDASARRPEPGPRQVTAEAAASPRTTSPWQPDRRSQPETPEKRQTVNPFEMQRAEAGP
jgi:hypothetical protein